MLPRSHKEMLGAHLIYFCLFLPGSENEQETQWRFLGSSSTNCVVTPRQCFAHANLSILLEIASRYLKIYFMREKTEARVIKKLGSQDTFQNLLTANGSTFVRDWNKGRTLLKIPSPTLHYFLKPCMARKQNVGKIQWKIFSVQLEFCNAVFTTDSQHFNFGTYGKGFVRPVEKKAVGQDHLPRCTRSVTFWGKSNQLQFIKQVCLVLQQGFSCN